MLPSNTCPTRPPSLRCRGARSLFLVAVALVSVLWGPGHVEPVGAVELPDPNWAEADFVARINDLRANHGLAPLVVDPELTAQARRWAQTMAAAGHIFHASDLSTGITTDWQKLGENVGVGAQTGPLFNAFVESPGHYANLVDPAFTRIGVGVVNAGDRLYTAHRFLSPAPTPPPAPPAPAVPPPRVPTTPLPPVTAPPVTAPPATVPPTTAPTTAGSTNTAPTTTVPTNAGGGAGTHKLGPLERIPEMIGAGPDED